jgi:hypothetical protein
MRLRAMRAVAACSSSNSSRSRPAGLEATFTTRTYADLCFIFVANTTDRAADTQLSLIHDQLARNSRAVRLILPPPRCLCCCRAKSTGRSSFGLASPTLSRSALHCQHRSLLHYRLTVPVAEMKAATVTAQQAGARCHHPNRLSRRAPARALIAAALSR